MKKKLIMIHVFTTECTNTCYSSKGNGLFVVQGSVTITT